MLHVLRSSRLKLPLSLAVLIFNNVISCFMHVEHSYKIKSLICAIGKYVDYYAGECLSEMISRHVQIKRSRIDALSLESRSGDSNGRATELLINQIRKKLLCMLNAQNVSTISQTLHCSKSLKVSNPAGFKAAAA